MIWRSLFLLATTFGVVVLMVLLLTIIDDTFGYVAVQYKIDPQELVLNHFKRIVLNAPSTETSEDDEYLAQQIARRDNAVGYFGYAYYKEHADTLRLVPIDGITPDAETVSAGQYPLARPLFIYTSLEALRAQGSVAAFVGYYLSHVSERIDQIGYFPAPQESIDHSLRTWQQATGLTPDTMLDNVTMPGVIVASGSSTVMPITRYMAEQMRQEGYDIQVDVEAVGSGTGLQDLCSGRADIANASRAIGFSEQLLCQENKITPIEFRIASDGLAVVVSRENDFVDGFTSHELQQVFTTARKWTDVRAEWPDHAILRLIPAADSGTLDFFMYKIFGSDPATQPREVLIAFLEENLSRGLIRRFNKEQPLEARQQDELYQLVYERVLEPTLIKTWTLSDSIFHKSEIEVAAAEIPRSELVFRSWLNKDFLTSPQSSQPELAGVRTAMLGSLWVVLVTLIFAVPVGIGAAIYLEEYGSGNWLDQLIETNINNLAGVPSIIYGMLGLAVFVRVLEPLTSGKMFGVVDATTANGRTILSAGLTLGLLILPIIIINAREAIRAVPQTFREASYGLGATHWQTIWSHVLPNAIPGILTGSILAISRAFGETAPLVIVGASTAIFVNPSGPFSKFTTLPIQIYQWTARPQAAFQNLAAAAIMVLLIMLLALNATAIYLRNRYQARY